MTKLSIGDFMVLLDLQKTLRRMDFDRLPLKNLVKLRMEVNGLVERTIQSNTKWINSPEETKNVN